MERMYPVTLGQAHVGKVLLKQKGLYYHILCRCNLPGDTIYRLTVSCNTSQENLGVLVPEEGSFVLNTKIAVKRIGEGELSFSLITPNLSLSPKFVPISSDEPFSYISRLKQSFLTLQDGITGAMIP